jgi:hypothetical protein
MRLPSVLLAIIPISADWRGFRLCESFDIAAIALVTIEMRTGFVSLTHDDEIGSHVTAWEQLLSIAVRGRAARGHPCSL